MPKGPLSTKNNPTLTDLIGVTLANSTAKTWTHTFGVTPISVDVFINNAVNGGQRAGLLAADATNTGVNVTTTINTIVLTPGSAAANTFNVVVVWTIPPQFVNGDPATDFV